MQIIRASLVAPDPSIVVQARLQAAKMNFDGRDSPATRRHIQRCTHYHRPTQALIIYTRDTGMHSSGWWKNPDYERCLHLSLSFVGQQLDQHFPLPFDRKMAARWAEIFFGDEARKCWIEPPFSPEGKARDVHHYRLFCDPSWRPMLPRGEVYSKGDTPARWLSWSDLHATAP